MNKPTNESRAKLCLANFFSMKLGDPGVLLTLALFWPLCEKGLFKIKWKVAVEIFTSFHRSP